MADDDDFQTVDTIATVDGVGVAVVLNERDELIAAARIARVMIAVKRQEEQKSH